MDKKRILVIDDEKNIRLTLGTLLESLGYLIDIAATGAEGVIKASCSEYFLAFLDMKLPGQDGMAILKQLKELHPSLNVIMMTAFSTVESAVAAMKLGAVDYLPKPFNPDMIKQLLDQITEREVLTETTENYSSLVHYAEELIAKRDFETARQYLKTAIGMDTTRPEAFYLLGVLYEALEDLPQAKIMFRTTLSLDPTYSVAQEDLHRLVSG